MATGTGPLGENLNAGMNVPNITPDVNYSAGLGAYEQLAQVGRRFDATIQKSLNERAASKGKAEGAAIASGQAEYKSHWYDFSESGQARKDALTAAYTAGTRTDIDARERALRSQFAYDPDGYKKATDAMVSGFIQNAPGEFATDVEAYARAHVDDGLSVVSAARQQRDDRESVATVNARQKALEESLLDMAATAGGDTSFGFMRAQAEWTGLEIEKIGNPLFAYTPEQSSLAEAGLLDRIGGTVVTRDALSTFTTAGGGLPGYAAAKRFLSDEFLNGEEFASIPPERRARYVREATKNLDAAYAGDREARRAETAARTDAERAQRDAAEDLKLRIELGEAGRGEVMAAQRGDQIDDGMAASLLRYSDTRARRQAADARRAAGGAASGDHGYKDLRAQAGAGTLTDSDIADGIASGVIDRAQAQTLRNVRNGARKADLDMLTGPVFAAIDRRPGLSADRKRELRRQAEVAANTVFERTPDATPDERAAQAAKMLPFFAGGQAGGGPGAAQAAEGARRKALAAQYKAGKMTYSRYQELLKGGH